MPSCPRCRLDNPSRTVTCAGCGARLVASALPATTPVVAQHVAPEVSTSSQNRRMLSKRRRVWIALIALLSVLLVFAFSSMNTQRLQTVDSAPPAKTGGAVVGAPPFPTTGGSASQAQTAVSVPGGVLLTEDFTDPARSRLLVADNDTASYAVRDGAYVIALKQPQFMARSSLGGDYDNIAIDADVTFVSGPEESAAGIIFRYQDDDNFYLFRIAEDSTYSLAVYNGGQQHMLLDWTASPAINGAGQPNRLRLEAAGEQIQVSVNGELLGEANDSSLSAGEIGLAVSTFDQGGAVYQFDNLVVRRLN